MLVKNAIKKRATGIFGPCRYFLITYSDICKAFTPKLFFTKSFGFGNHNKHQH